MTAERTHKPPFSQELEQGAAVPELSPAILIPITRRAHERNLAGKEREMLLGFFDYAHQKFALDPRLAQPEQSEDLALVTQAFLASVVQRRLAALGDSRSQHSQENGATSPPIYATPADPVQRNIRTYYRQFGYNRRQKSDRLRAVEEAYLREKKRPIYVRTYSGGSNNAEGQEFAIKESFARAATFPELGLGIRLEELLRKQGYRVAADSTEVVLAAYGGWFPERVRTAGEHGIIRVRQDTDTHNIKHWQQEEIPEEFRAENYRPQ